MTEPTSSPAFQPAASPNRLPYIVGGIVLVLILGIGGAVFATRGGDATSVREVADQAKSAAEDLDVDKGIDLLCGKPSSKDVKDLRRLISRAQDDAGTKNPDVTYSISDVEGKVTGRFRVNISSSEKALSDKAFALQVGVKQVKGRTCISGLLNQ